MNRPSERHHRQSIRLEQYDYTQPGAYFITLVTYQRQPLFGQLKNGPMELSRLGDLAVKVWQGLEVRIPTIQLDEFVIMPDHIHGIIIIIEQPVGARREELAQSGSVSLASPATSKERKLSLGDVVGIYKSTIARVYNSLNRTRGRRIWQRNYYEHIIRNDSEWDLIRLYIQENPFRWGKDDNDAYPWE